MRVMDLIEKLKSFPAGAEVLLQGYEDGFDDVVSVQEIKAARRPQPYDWEGDYEEAEKDDKAAPAPWS